MPSLRRRPVPPRDPLPAPDPSAGAPVAAAGPHGAAARTAAAGSATDPAGGRRDRPVDALTTARAASPWADTFGRAAVRGLQGLALVAVLVVATRAVSSLTLVVIPVLLALVLAAAIYPVVRLFERVMPPALAATLALLGLAAVLGGVLAAVVLAVSRQWDELADSAVEGVQQLSTQFSQLPFDISDEQIQDVRQSATEFLTSSTFGTSAVAGVSATANFVTGLVLMLVVLFFFLKDGPRLWEFLLRPFEGESYARARRAGDQTMHTLGGYVRGTAIVAAVDAIGIGIGLVLLRVPLAIPLAVLTFLLAFVPLVGATLAGVLAALVALVTNGPTAALVVIGVVVLVQQIEGNFLQPVVMARSLALHPLVILIALTIGTVLVGITGAVLAVPIAASIWGVLKVWNGEHEPAHPVAVKHRPTPADGA
ncbi:AI-2E family transporter [Cellulomonas endophytica]|uniref:AI-2E family transporter n=1 Tax=Cellulomonas endophytica TaxID=2494735 RepID=UPI00101294AF|nr:AI-2E family transporter [Cellulomonas endophytica]